VEHWRTFLHNLLAQFYRIQTDSIFPSIGFYGAATDIPLLRINFSQIVLESFKKEDWELARCKVEHLAQIQKLFGCIMAELLKRYIFFFFEKNRLDHIRPSRSTNVLADTAGSGAKIIVGNYRFIGTTLYIQQNVLITCIRRI